MNRGLLIALVAVGCLMAAERLRAQAAPAQNPPANNTQQPANQQKPAESNPFPDDTTNVPVMPSKGTPPLPEGTYTGDEPGAGAHVPLRSDDLDPVRSPDDAAHDTSSAADTSSSDSSSGLDKILPPSGDDDQSQRKHRKLAVPGPEHQETAKEDINVGGYYLQIKNWKAALSRFESAMVLSPDEPDVYWGLAESERHLGDLAAARGYYQKVAEYDPDSKHGKEAIKALKEPEIANAKALPPAQPAK
jgi:tetratricopeptide (TPR) repeat protein